MVGFIRAHRRAVIGSRTRDIQAPRQRREKRAPCQLRPEQLEDRRLLSLLTVNTTLDEINPLDTTLSLREAIDAANSNPGADTIGFNIPTTDPGYNTQWWTITLTMGDLPTLFDSGTTIDGTTQPGYASRPLVGTGGTVGVDNIPLPQYRQPLIAIDDLQAGNAMSIDISASNILVEALSIYNAQNAIKASTFDGFFNVGNNRVLDSMFIGVLPDGSDPAAFRNTFWGVLLDDSGDPTADSNLTVQNSYVGNNGYTGIDCRNGEILGPYCTLIVTGNEVFQNGWQSLYQDGIVVGGRNSLVYGNFSHDNTTLLGIPRGEGGAGIEMDNYVGSLGLAEGLDAGNNVIKDNTVANNLSSGISDVQGQRGNQIIRNIVYGNQVGISINQEDAIVDPPTNRNLISRNSTYLNFGLGIDLEDQNTIGPWEGFAAPGGRNPLAGPVGSPTPFLDGVTPNDPLDSDTYSNDLQNWPVLTAAVGSGNSTSISGTLSSTPNSTFSIEFFWTPDTDLFAPDDREGHYFLGSKSVTTDAFGNASFTANFNAAIASASLIFATATVTALPSGTIGSAVNDTSEFSNGVVRTSVSEVGKVTGGGSIDPALVVSSSPATPSSDHRANFGFNAKYKKDDPIPTGHTNFNWNPGNVHFDSTSYDPLSLVVTTPAPGIQKAQWTGKGTVNHQPGYTFKVQVTDAGEPGTNDSFRIQIKNSAAVIVYDNGADPDVETTLATGNIQIHMASNAQEASDGLLSSVTNSPVLTQNQLQPVLQQAIMNWSLSDLTQENLSALAHPSILIADLSGSLLGLAAGNIIAIDANAAGHLWFTNPSPAATPAPDQMDLLTVITHELGHLLGLGDTAEPGIMAGTLRSGVRLIPEIGQSHATFPTTHTPATLSPLAASPAARTPRHYSGHPGALELFEAMYLNAAQPVTAAVRSAPLPDQTPFAINAIRAPWPLTDAIVLGLAAHTAASQSLLLQADQSAELWPADPATGVALIVPQQGQQSSVAQNSGITHRSHPRSVFFTDQRQLPALVETNALAQLGRKQTANGGVLPALAGCTVLLGTWRWKLTRNQRARRRRWWMN